MRQKTIENKKNEMREKNDVWDQKRTDVKNRALTIDHQDYQELVPAQYKSKTFPLATSSKGGSPSKDGLQPSNLGPILSPRDSPGQRKGGKASSIDKESI